MESTPKLLLTREVSVKQIQLTQEHFEAHKNTDITQSLDGLGMDSTLVLPAKESYLDDVERWLEEEKDNRSHYLIYDWLDNERKGDSLFYILNGKAIGVCLFEKDDKSFRINLFSINPEYKRQKHGRNFYTLLEKQFKEQGALVIELSCIDEVSEKFWKNLDFRKYPVNFFPGMNYNYYKVLIDTLANSKIPSTNKIQLNFISNNDMSTLVFWNMNNTEGLQKAIIYPFSIKSFLFLVKDEGRIEGYSFSELIGDPKRRNELGVEFLSSGSYTYLHIKDINKTYPTDSSSL